MVKAQMRVQQMAFMLIAVTLFFVLVGLFVLSTQFSGLKKSAENLREQEAMLLASKISSTPEFSCGSTYGAVSTCIDSDKLISGMDYLKDYSDFYGIKNIEIRKVHPESNQTCTRLNYPNCGVFLLFQDGNNSIGDKSSFVSLCRKESRNSKFYNKCEIAKIYVRY